MLAQTGLIGNWRRLALALLPQRNAQFPCGEPRDAVPQSAVEQQVAPGPSASQSQASPRAASRAPFASSFGAVPPASLSSGRADRSQKKTASLPRLELARTKQ